MDIAISSLSSDRESFFLHFKEPLFWHDPVEKLIYTAKFPNEFENNIPKVFACCMTKNQLSEAAWIAYGYNKTGLGAKCVKFSFNSSKLCSELAEKAKEAGYTLYAGMVHYLSFDSIRELSDSNSMIYKTIFQDGFNKESFLKMLLLKREAFYYEKEIRFFLVSASDTNNQRTKTEVQKLVQEKHFENLKIKLKGIVNKIYYSESCTEVESNILKNYYDKFTVKKSTLYKQRGQLNIPIQDKAN